MKYTALFAAISVVLTACPSFEEVPLQAGGNIVCYYGEDIVVFTGTITLRGQGLDEFKERINGQWQLCGEDRVKCYVGLPSGADAE